MRIDTVTAVEDYDERTIHSKGRVPVVVDKLVVVDNTRLVVVGKLPVVVDTRLAVVGKSVVVVDTQGTSSLAGVEPIARLHSCAFEPIFAPPLFAENRVAAAESRQPVASDWHRPVASPPFVRVRSWALASLAGVAPSRVDSSHWLVTGSTAGQS